MLDAEAKRWMLFRRRYAIVDVYEQIPFLENNLP
jgi:hypothetical protein